MGTGDDRPLAVVVGGGGGIGSAVAVAQRAEGHTVLTWDVRAGDVACDIRDPASIEAALEQTLTTTGVPRLVTVTAGVGHAASLLELDAEEWDRVLRVNARGPWLAMRALARAMVEAGQGGSIVATTSISARLADPSMGAYCASKAALTMLVRVAALEWAAHGIRVNAVAPGVTDTAMLGAAPRDRGWLAAVAARTPLGRLGTPADVAAAILAVHGAGWMTGQVVEVDGGLGLSSPITAPAHYRGGPASVAQPDRAADF